MMGKEIHWQVHNKQKPRAWRVSQVRFLSVHGRAAKYHAAQDGLADMKSAKSALYLVTHGSSAEYHA